MQTSKNILLTGSRTMAALALARYFHRAGHTVYMTDCLSHTLSAHSKTVKRYFQLPSPRFATQQFIAELVHIINKYNIDLVVPTFEETFYLAQYRYLFPETCTIFCADFESLHRLHHKWLFQNRLAELDFPMIKSQLITSRAELEALDFPKPYIIKACYSRASLSFYLIKENSTLPDIEISKDHPWVAQEYLVGNKYCTYSVANKGRMYAHAAYPVKIAIDGQSCVLLEAINNLKIEAWVNSFIEKENYTGQVAFDFIETADGTLYALECNPRATSGVHLFPATGMLAPAFYNENIPLIYPIFGTQRQILMGMLLYGWHTSACQSLLLFLKNLLATPDIIFDKNDVLPFIAQAYVFPHILYDAYKLKCTLSAVFNHGLEWNGENLRNVMDIRVC